MLYELLTGAVPFDAEAAVTIALKQVSEEPVPPRVRNPAVPPALDAVTLRALQKDPAARYQDADQFIAALEQAQAGVIADDPVAELEAQDERSWRRIALIAVAVLALVAIAVGAWLLLTPDQKAVPDVVGDRTQNATEKLQGAGFEVSVTPIQSDEVEEDRVAGQEPAAGEDADEGSEVTITVSSGPGEAPVPLVQGLGADAATDRLRDAGFPSEQERRYSDTVGRGKVIGTNPAEGTSVRKGTTVTIIVSRGREQVEVPDVTGQPQADAEAALQQAGLDATVTEQEDAGADPGTVLSQDPAGGAQVAPGSSVALVVATAPADVPVPGVIDASEDDARTTLEEAGFEVRVRETDVDTPDQDGLVVDQDPAEDVAVQPGSRVTITVGRFEVQAPTTTATPVP